MGAGPGVPGVSRARAPLLAMAAVVVVLTGLALVLWRGSAVPGNAGAEPDITSSGGPAPDISRMTPRERFDRLYTRVMQAARTGDSATFTRFAPMALGAYEMLDSIDADARYHVALLRLHLGDAPGARALADTILLRAPGHLLGYVMRGTAARWQRDSAALPGVYADFLARYDAEVRAGRPEYQEHRVILDEFRRAAQGSRRQR